MRETGRFWRAGLIGRGALVMLCLIAAGCAYAPAAEQGGRPGGEVRGGGARSECGLLRVFRACELQRGTGTRTRKGLGSISAMRRTC